MMKKLKYVLLALAIAASLGVIAGTSFHSVEEIHYLKSFYPGDFTVSQALQAAVVELIKILLISYPLLIVIAVSVVLIRIFAGRDSGR